jgi:hypothetical protein
MLPDPFVLLGIMTTGSANPNGGTAEGTVWVSKEAVDNFSKDYDWEYIEKPDGSFQVHYFKVTK